MLGQKAQKTNTQLHKKFAEDDHWQFKQMLWVAGQSIKDEDKSKKAVVKPG